MVFSPNVATVLWLKTLTINVPPSFLALLNYPQVIFAIAPIRDALSKHRQTIK